MRRIGYTFELEQLHRYYVFLLELNEKDSSGSNTMSNALATAPYKARLGVLLYILYVLVFSLTGSSLQVNSKTPLPVNYFKMEKSHKVSFARAMQVSLLV